ncbi:hypothetical protein DSCA_15530 [Desulfosarcina alkanivorans]|uniref:Uncharacterized protein n=1 Tax=Desulfosarcina alkanivorans TaxID=571177 RepID=A0A5K7YGD1_9BACT|nr:hypothetical protein [Desulfosarcina alkanivorans]BBO67623.1 hypothetical protein DSCA_15530 [Desulfosarcina alkanivorans]
MANAPPITLHISSYRRAGLILLFMWPAVACGQPNHGQPPVPMVLETIVVTADRRALRLTGNLERDDVDHTLSGDHHRVTAGFGAQAEHHWKTFTTTLGGRGDHTSDFDFHPGFSGGLSHAMNRHWLL